MTGDSKTNDSMASTTRDSADTLYIAQPRSALPKGGAYSCYDPKLSQSRYNNRKCLFTRENLLFEPTPLHRKTAVPCSIHSYTRVGLIPFISPFPVKEREIMPPEHITAAQPSGVTRPFDSFETTRLALHARFEYANAAHERGLYDMLHRKRGPARRRVPRPVLCVLNVRLTD